MKMKTVATGLFSQDSELISSLLQSIPKCDFVNFSTSTTDEQEVAEEDKHEKEDTIYNKDDNFSRNINLTEPSDSPFRVRRISRSFSISAGKCSIEPPESEEELFCTTSNLSEKVKKSNFILLKRSRSLGHIFSPDHHLTEKENKNNLWKWNVNNDKVAKEEGVKIKTDDGINNESEDLFIVNIAQDPTILNTSNNQIDELTEKVEALEIEVLQEDQQQQQQKPKHIEIENHENFSPVKFQVANFKQKNANFNPSIINRPQTSPPTLIRSNEIQPTTTASDSSVPVKMNILDKMQKSLGFFFRCARKDSLDDDNVISLPISKLTDNNSKTVNNSTIRTRSIKTTTEKHDRAVPLFRSRTPDDKKSKLKLYNGDDDDVPMNKMDGSAFVTKIDESTQNCQTPSTSLSHRPHSPPRLPQFYDVIGPKGPLLSAVHEADFGKKCLVLDLDETLVHSTFHVPEAHDLVVPLSLPDGSIQNIYVAKRPGVDEFLKRACELFEVVIFTASLSRYADPVIDFLVEGMMKVSTAKNFQNDNQTNSDSVPLSLRIRHRLYRESCLFLQGLYVKDLSRLGRALEHTVIVDNSPASFILQPDHGIPIKSWFNDTTDLELSILMDSLTILARSENVKDWKRECSRTGPTTCLTSEPPMIFK